MLATSCNQQYGKILLNRKQNKKNSRLALEFLLVSLAVYATSGLAKHSIIALLFLASFRNIRISKNDIRSASLFIALFFLSLFSYFSNFQDLPLLSLADPMQYGAIGIILLFISRLEVDLKRFSYVFLFFWLLFSLKDYYLNLGGEGSSKSKTFETIGGGSTASFAALFLYVHLRERSLGYILIIITALGILIFGQRSAVLALIFYEFIKIFSFNSRQEDFLFKFSFFIIIIVAAVLFLIPNYLFNVVDQIYIAVSGQHGLAYDTAGRWTFWSILNSSYDIENIKSIIFGYGPKSAGIEIKNQLGNYYMPHNDFFKLLYEIGVVGTAICMFFLYWSLKKMYGLLFVFCIAMFFSNILLYVGPCLFAFTLVDDIKKNTGKIIKYN